jgi:hypothetical protein
LKEYEDAAVGLVQTRAAAAAARAAVLDASGGKEVGSRAAPLFDSVGWVRGFEALLVGEAEGAAGR